MLRLSQTSYQLLGQRGGCSASTRRRPSLKALAHAARSSGRAMRDLKWATFARSRVRMVSLMLFSVTRC